MIRKHRDQVMQTESFESPDQYSESQLADPPGELELVHV